MQSTYLAMVLVVLGGCGGTQFQGVTDDSTLPDAGSSVPEVDAAPPLPPLVEGGSADVRAGGDAPGSVEASADGGAAPDSATPGPEAGEDARDAANDAWPSDVVVEPYCPDSELFPTYSVTCDTWGQAHGWTAQGCCMPDHTCGAVQEVPRQDLPPTRMCRK